MADINNVLIAGAGTMGQQIGLQSAMHGFEVTIYDIDKEALTTAKKRIGRYLDALEDDVEEGRSSVEQRLRFTTNLTEAAQSADLVSESVPEDPDLKGKVLGEVHHYAPDHCIFTTNTSTLLPSMFAEASGRPDKLVALHFHPDVWTSNVADVMPHPGTSQETIDITVAFARAIDQIPIVLEKEHSGYVFNTMLVALLGAANQLVVGEVASHQDVDRAWMGIMHTPSGPFGIMDYIGLDTVYKVANFWAERNQDPIQQRVAQFFKENYVDRGYLGIKSGQGFYRYPKPEFSHPNFLRSKGDSG